MRFLSPSVPAHPPPPHSDGLCPAAAEDAQARAEEVPAPPGTVKVMFIFFNGKVRFFFCSFEVMAVGFVGVFDGVEYLSRPCARFRFGTKF